jgi:diguanylate cyclase (GGDEF)-like protein
MPLTICVSILAIFCLTRIFSLKRKNKLLNEEIKVVKKEIKEITFEASHDALTKLSNRAAFDAAFAAFWAQKKLFYIVIVDMDNLKKINDIEGHLEGDKALCNLASLLAEYFEKVFRVGGDEFIIISEENPAIQMQQLQQIAEGYNILFSYGIASNVGHSKKGTFFVEAEVRMYQQKREHHALSPRYTQNAII